MHQITWRLQRREVDWSKQRFSLEGLQPVDNNERVRRTRFLNLVAVPSTQRQRYLVLLTLSLGRYKNGGNVKCTGYIVLIHALTYRISKDMRNIKKAVTCRQWIIDLTNLPVTTMKSLTPARSILLNDQSCNGRCTVGSKCRGKPLLSIP